jgi:hypothetical protein
MLTSIVKCHLLDNELVDMTIKALETIVPYSDETIVVSTPDSIKPDCFMGYLEDRKIKYFVTDKGFPNFITKGVEVAHGDYVAVLNNDILFKGDWSKPLLGLFEDDTLLVHPKMLGWDDPILTGRQIKENIDPKQGMFFSAFIVNKKLFNEVGWDMEYDYSGYDDWDFYYRALKGGYHCLWTDIVQYKHKGGATMDKVGRDQYYKKNREIFIKKHGVRPEEIDWYGL